MNTVPFLRLLRSATSSFCLLIMSAVAIAGDEPAQPPSPESKPQGDLESYGAIATFFATNAYAYLATNQLGIEVMPADDALKSQLGIESGLVVTKVPEESEGGKFGLKPHDVILNVNGPRSEPVRTLEALNVLLSDNAGKKIEIGLLRGGKMLLLAVDVPKRQELAIDAAIKDALIQQSAQVTERYRLGVTLSEADATLRSQLQLPEGEGLIITGVISKTPAEKAGLKTHDVLVELDAKPVGSVEGINEQVQKIKSREVTAKFMRSGKVMSADVTPEKVADPIHGTTSAYPAATYERLQGTVYLNDVGVQFIPTLTSQGAELVLVERGGKQTPQSQIEILKKHLSEMQKAIAALEAELPKANVESPATPEEKK